MATSPPPDLGRAGFLAAIGASPAVNLDPVWQALEALAQKVDAHDEALSPRDWLRPVLERLDRIEARLVRLEAVVMGDAK